MQTRKTIVFIFILGLFLKHFNSIAQDSQMKFGAYLDSYYVNDFTSPDNNSRPYVTQYARNSEFNINHAWIRGQYESEKIRASLAIQTGTYPQYNYAAEPTLSQLIYEGYAGYKITKKGWLDIGVFGGHFGYESALSIDRELLSPALATEYTPYYQTGIRFTQDISEKTQFRAVVVNGWQNIQETNNTKSIGIAIDHQLSKTLFISYGNYFGTDLSLLADQVRRFHNNAIIQLTPTESISLTGIIDWTLQRDYTLDENETYSATFYTLISSFQLSDKWSLNGRYEYVKDLNEVLIDGAYDGFEQNVVSISANFQPIENAIFKIEPKWYFGPSDYSTSSKQAFVFQAGVAIRIE